ncbi:MAG TPA: flagellar motor protein MotB [Acidobacteriaceae bacterium]
MTEPAGSGAPARSTSMSRRRVRPAGPTSAPSHERWLVSYADFMTLLFAFFVVLFASSRHSSQGLQKVAGSIHEGFSSMGAHAPEQGSPGAPSQGKPATQAPAKGTVRPKAAPSAELDLPGLQRQLQDVLGDSIARHEIVVEQRPDGLVISLRELGFFDSGRASLLPGAVEKITRTAQVLNQHHLEIRVEGHSDDQPIHTAAFHSNWELSSARAMTVLLLLIDKGGFDPSRISLSAYGPYHALASNQTAEGRRVNRRVDLVIVSPGSGTQPAH